jgi:hypothetical protein
MVVCSQCSSCTSCCLPRSVRGQERRGEERLGVGTYIEIEGRQPSTARRHLSGWGNSAAVTSRRIFSCRPIRPPLVFELVAILMGTECRVVRATELIWVFRISGSSWPLISVSYTGAAAFYWSIFSIIHVNSTGGIKTVLSSSSGRKVN